jgi:putative ABC transport system permease protein
MRGRLFQDSDREATVPVALIDQTFAERHWPGEDPVGRRVKLSRDPDSPRPWLEIIGVVGRVKNLGVDRESREAIYRPYFQEAERYMTLVVATVVPPEAAAAMVRRVVAEIDPDQPIYRVRPLDQYLADRMVPRRVSSVALIVFAFMALLLAAVGIYGLMTYTVSRRTREIGIRLAMGAKTQDIHRMVWGRVARLTVLGVVIGLAAAFFVAPLTSGLLFGVDARDPVTFLGIALLLGVVAMLSSLIPARRAARVEPLVALRHE